MSEINSQSLLQKAIAASRVPNTMLLFGPDLNTLKSVAIETASALLRCLPACAQHHPDFHCMTPDAKSDLHLIESIRTSIERSHIAPFEGVANIFVIESAEKMQPVSANALLKTLEEPNLDTYWILLSSNPRDILPTILSRCIQFSFPSYAHAARLSGAAQILHSLLRDRPSYPKLALALERIEKALESEGSALELFTEIAHYFREEAALAIDDEVSWEEPLQDAMLAFERNIKLSTCLEAFFLRIS